MLQAKLCMPHIGEQITRRKRVEETLRRLPNCQFAFITAPAGYGKTTAVADYLTREKLKYAWFSVDGTDNDPVRFWKYLFSAMEFIEANDLAFRYYDGRTEEIVYDQNRVMAVSENAGDLILTDVFENYCKYVRSSVLLCRGFNTESKVLYGRPKN